MRGNREAFSEVGRTPTAIKHPRTAQLVGVYQTGQGPVQVWWEPLPGGAYLWAESDAWRKHLIGRLIVAKDRKEAPRSEVEALTEQYLLSALGGEGRGPVAARAYDPYLAEQCPRVHAFVTSTVGVGGQTRPTSTLTVYWEEGVCKVCLGEREHNLSLWATGDDLHGALHALEQRLQAPKVEWRRKTQWKGPKDPRAKR